MCRRVRPEQAVATSRRTLGPLHDGWRRPGARRIRTRSEGTAMPRYLVERNFKDGLHVPVGAEGRALFGGIVQNNADSGVTWVHSYVSEDRSKTFCIYDEIGRASCRERV